MKQLFLVFGKGSMVEAQLARSIELPKSGAKGVVIYTMTDTDQEAIKRVQAAIRIYGDGNYENMLVAYAGNNLKALPENMPCATWNMFVLMQALHDFTHDEAIPIHHGMLEKLFASSLEAFLKPSVPTPQNFTPDWIQESA